MSLVQSPGASISQCLFMDNTAKVVDSAAVVAYACGGGNGGAMCIFGTSRSSIIIQASVFFNNTANFGGGVSLHADPTCTQQELSTGCFSATFDARCNFTANTADAGAGGAVFWTQNGNLNISCSGTRALPVATGKPTTVLASLPYVELPCSDWNGNQVTGAGYGPVIASSSFYLQPQASDLTYYSSNQPLPLSVMMLVGGLCGGNACDCHLHCFDVLFREAWHVVLAT